MTLQKLAAEGETIEKDLSRQIDRARKENVVIKFDGKPVTVKYYTCGGREVTHSERVAGAQAKRAADSLRKVETPDWIVRLSSDSES